MQLDAEENSDPFYKPPVSVSAPASSAADPAKRDGHGDGDSDPSPATAGAEITDAEAAATVTLEQEA